MSLFNNAITKNNVPAGKLLAQLSNEAAVVSKDTFPAVFKLNIHDNEEPPAYIKARIAANEASKAATLASQAQPTPVSVIDPEPATSQPTESLVSDPAPEPEKPKFITRRKEVPTPMLKLKRKIPKRILPD